MEQSDPLTYKQVKEVLTVLEEMEQGIWLVKTEFQEGKHSSISSVVQKIDLIMRSSVLRAQAEKAVNKDEQGVKQILQKLNINMGEKVNKLLKAEDQALGLSSKQIRNTERYRIYENKIRLMHQQIDSLKKDLSIKVKLDQRKLKYAREQMSQFHDQIYGRVPGDNEFDALGREMQVIPITDLPNFPSPYATQ